MTIYILGGGPAGLGIAHGLTQDSEFPFVVLERGSTVGGLAQTLQWGDNDFHDLGPHKIFSLDKELIKQVEDILPEDAWLTRPKQSSIYMKGHFLPYPPSPFSLINVYGPSAFISMVLNYGGARLKSLVGNTEPKTFEEDLETRMGRKLYEALFKPIAVKLWGDPRELDVKLSKSRVQTPALSEVIGRLLGIKSSSDFEALDFRYPKGGLQKIWEGIVKKSQGQGTYLNNQRVTDIIIKDNKVSMIRYKNCSSAEEKEIKIGKDDFVLSTIPLAHLTKLMGDAIPSDTAKNIKDVVKLNDLLLVFLKIDKPRLLDDCWVFVPDPEIAFHRLSEQESFDPDMTPGGSIVCCEIMSNDMRPKKESKDSELIDAAKKGLAEMGYSGFSVLDEKVIRLPNSYPVFRPGYEPVLEDILNTLDRFSNFRTVGRQGAFNYIGTLDAMDIGLGAARWIINKGPSDTQTTWKEERQRTSHYPILD